jgi:repressor LexA
MLTPQQKRLFDFIVAKIDGEGVAPTFTDIQAHLGLKSKSGIHRILSCLEERGFIRRIPNRRQAIDVVRRHDVTASLVGVLREAEEYFDSRADADGRPDGSFVGNEEMRLLVSIRDVLAQAGGAR